VIVHNTEQHCGFGSAVPPKIAYYPGVNLPHFGNHCVKRYNRVSA